MILGNILTSLFGVWIPNNSVSERVNTDLMYLSNSQDKSSTRVPGSVSKEFPYFEDVKV